MKKTYDSFEEWAAACDRRGRRMMFWARVRSNIKRFFGGLNF